MEKVKITCMVRKGIGKETVKKTRKLGLIPAIVYGKEFNLAIELPLASLKTLKNIHFSENTVIDMKIDGTDTEEEKLSVLIKDIQYNPLTEDVIHIDFIKVSLKERIKVRVPIRLKGECKGVKDGGILEQMLWEVELEALPLEIPETIELDVTNLEIGRSLHVSDLTVSSGVRLIDSASATVVTVVAMKEEEVEEEVPEAEEAKEPEVIKEKDKETKEETKEQ